LETKTFLRQIKSHSSRLEQVENRLSGLEDKMILRKNRKVGYQWLMHIILASQQAEKKRIIIQS
jgi:hypothetical protein